jgi:hypothetical protein
MQPPPQPLPTRPLPEAVWGDHLLPMLTCKEAVRLVRTCKALRVVVREHVKDLGTVKVDKLQAALTTFPRARKATLWDFDEESKPGAPEALVQWLREGGHGAGVTTLRTYIDRSDGAVIDVIHAALRQGALPSLTGVAAGLEQEAHRALLTGGFLGGMHELRLTVDRRGDHAEVVPQLAALGLVRRLPALATLHLEIRAPDDEEPVRYPPFIPPSLKALVIDVTSGGLRSDLLFRALPGMLEASGAALERLEVRIFLAFEWLGDGLVHLAQTLRCCSRTLKGFHLVAEEDIITIDDKADDYEDQVERLRVQWAELLAGVSACRELENLELPTYIAVEPLFPPGIAFARLTHLEIGD